jgi:hypothetical protein
LPIRVNRIGQECCCFSVLDDVAAAAARREINVKRKR